MSNNARLQPRETALRSFCCGLSRQRKSPVRATCQRSDLFRRALDGTLQSAVEEWSRRTGVEADFHSAGLAGRRLPGEVETALYRVVLEALYNTQKHARALRSYWPVK